MEVLRCQLSADEFDKAVHEGLPECGDLAVYIKPNATVRGNPMVVVTFTVQLPDGTKARVQATTTLALYESTFACIRGWKSGGLL